VEVRACLDNEEPRYEYSKSRYLENKGINIRLIGGSGIMYKKFCIIDDRITITGLYNWTTRADLENDENIVIIESEEIAHIYKDQFLKYWNGNYIDTCVYNGRGRDRLVNSLLISPRMKKYLHLHRIKPYVRLYFCIRIY